jgi:hypothetical protein
MYLPSFESELLKDVVESLRKRHKSLKHRVREIACERVLEKIDERTWERLDIEFIEPAGAMKRSLRLRLWDDRYVWVDCRAPQKKGWAWEWSDEGRLLGDCNGRRLLELFEQTLDVSASMETSRLQEFATIWRKVLAKGPKRLI